MVSKRSSKLRGHVWSPLLDGSEYLLPFLIACCLISQTTVRAQQEVVAVTESQSASAVEHAAVIVIHRLRHAKLATWIARYGLNLTRFQPADAPSSSVASEIYTNVVAGYVLDSKRTIVVARLGFAEVETEASPAPSDSTSTAAAAAATTLTKQQAASEFVVVQLNGTRSTAKFIGLDARTGLSFLTVDAAALNLNQTTAMPDVNDPAVGSPLPNKKEATLNRQSKFVDKLETVNLDQPIRLLAPTNSNQQQPQTTSVQLQMSEATGRLIQVWRASDARSTRFVAETSKLEAWFDGAVALGAKDELIGIVEDRRADQTLLVPRSVVAEAAQRVLARGASVPLPWLGVKGRTKNGGVLLTTVAPGTPAARAGLRVGDCIVRFNERNIHSAADFTKEMMAAEANHFVRFVVQRAQTKTKLHLITLKLGETFNPAWSMAEAEARREQQQRGAQP